MNKIVIIGAGPIGLYFASLCEENKVDYLLLEASEEIGGQINSLYPEKHIVDLPEYDSIVAKDYIVNLSKKINLKNIRFKSKVTKIVNKDNFVEITAGNNSFVAEYVVIATGLGFYTPRKLEIENEDKADNILYSLKDFSFLKNKKVVIFGGGDSALDWAKEISQISDDVHLVHRRTEFRGNADTIKDCKNLHLHLPFVPNSILIKDKKCQQLSIKNVETEEIININVEYVLVNFGSVPNAETYGYDHVGNAIKVNEKYSVSKRIFAIGDCAFYEGKIKRINPGNKEATIIFSEILKAV